MKRRSCRSAPWLVMAIALPLFSQNAKATPVVFSCASLASCSGSVAFSAGQASTTGIKVRNTVGPADDLLKFFTLTFNTSTNVAKLAEIAGDGSTLTGTIQGSLVSPPTSPTGPSGVTLTVLFNSLPLDFQTFIGTTDGDGFISTFELHGNGVTNANATISPTPESASYLLMGTGMLLCALVLRSRKRSSQATAVTA
jgi:hypothetical protein